MVYSFAYDYRHRLVKYTGYWQPWPGYGYSVPGTSWRLYDGDRVALRYDTVGGYTQTAQYLWGRDLAGRHASGDGTGGLLVVWSNGIGYLPHYDGRGNIWGFSGGYSRSLSAFGEVAFYPSGLPANMPIGLLTYAHGTKEYFSDIGLYNYGRRFYDPKTGRFIGRDPIQENGGLNLYAFVRNNPINKWDDLGLKEIIELDAFTVTAARIRSNGYSAAEWYLDYGDTTVDYGSGDSSSDEGGGSSDPTPIETERNPTTKRLVEKLQQLPCDKRKQLIDRAGTAFNKWGEMIAELTQVIFGGKNEAPAVIGDIVTGKALEVFDTHIFSSSEALNSYFQSKIIEETIEEIGVIAIFMTHSSRVNSSDLPESVALSTGAPVVPIVLFNPESATVISVGVKAIEDKSGELSSYRGSYPVLSSSPGIEVTSSKEFVDAIMTGCEK
ncbi:MAG: RHS repeat-associated core domain-containing protein [Opitutaceae bacterium]|nr:RHS repeat-associated core domain-containing protein [Opitutaceae bacterium]